MSYNGSGTFNINSAGQPVVTGTVITSTAFNALTADLGTGLTTAITKDGQTATTARIPFAAGINSTLVTDSTGTGSGSIITAGGVGVAKAITAGGAISSTSTTDATSTSTGSIITAGGVGVAKALQVGGDSAFTSTGALQIPASTTANRPVGVPGKIRYNTTLSTFEGYGLAWGSIGGGATGAGGDTVFQENQLIVTTSYTLSTGKSAMSVGPITINPLVAVTVPSGYRWVVL